MRRKVTAAKQKRPVRRQLSLLEVFRNFYVAKRAFFLVLFVAVPGLAWFSGVFGLMGNVLSERGERAFASAGFVVSDILVEGRQQADPKVILAAVGSTRGDPIFSCDPVTTKERLEKVTWIQSAMVQRRLPGTIYIRLVERNPVAIWQNESKRYLVDEHGAVIENFDAEEFRHLLVVTGASAPQHVKELLDSFSEFSEIREQVKSAVFISGRRWDLIMKNNVRIKLPERDMATALKNLQRMVKEHQITDGRVATIDLRLPDRSFLSIQEAEEDKKNKGKMT